MALSYVDKVINANILFFQIQSGVRPTYFEFSNLNDNRNRFSWRQKSFLLLVGLQEYNERNHLKMVENGLMFILLSFIIHFSVIATKQQSFRGYLLSITADLFILFSSFFSLILCWFSHRVVQNKLGILLQSTLFF